jgi:hypothetical protein
MVIAVSHVDTALLIGIGATNAVTIKRSVTKTKILFTGMKYSLILLLSIESPVAILCIYTFKVTERTLQNIIFLQFGNSRTTPTTE